MTVYADLMVAVAIGVIFAFFRSIKEVRLTLNSTYTHKIIPFSKSDFIPKEQNKIIKNMIRNRNKNKISISISKIERLYDKKSKGLIKMQGDKIVSFNEKPKYILNESNYFFSGLVLIPYQLKSKVLYELNRKKNKITDFSSDILTSKKFKINVLKTKTIPKDFGDWPNIIKNLIK